MGKEQTIGIQNHSVNGVMYELPVPVCEWLELMEDKCEARAALLAEAEKFVLSQEAEIRDYENRIEKLEKENGKIRGCLWNLAADPDYVLSMRIQLEAVMTEFEKEVKLLINKHSKENDSNTPDFILSQYLIACLMAFDTATQQRENWYGREPRPSHTGGDDKCEHGRGINDFCEPCGRVNDGQ